MTPEEVLERYFTLQTLTLAAAPYATKAGVRGFPGPPPGVGLLQKADLSCRNLLDAAGVAGAAALAARGKAGAATVLEASAAALSCAKETFRLLPDVALAAGLPWNAPRGEFDLVCLVPQSDRGSQRVAAEIAGAHGALRPGGRVLLAMHKDQGAKRYEKQVQEVFGSLRVLARAGGWRLSEAVRAEGGARTVPETSFHAAGFELSAPPGVFAAGKLDPGTALLLETLDPAELAGRSVLDLGCGYGVLALSAARAGAAVTATDDDLGAVRATYANARRYGFDVRCLHSDIDSALGPGERFEAVITNPPFHVGKQVRPLLPRAFLAAAARRLESGGSLTLVANRALPYEEDLAAWSEVTEVARNARFKVLRAIKNG